MTHRKKPGRKKLPKTVKKRRFSVTLSPRLIDAIEAKVTPEFGKNRLIEDTLTEKFLTL